MAPIIRKGKLIDIETKMKIIDLAKKSWPQHRIALHFKISIGSVNKIIKAKDKVIEEFEGYRGQPSSIGHNLESDNDDDLDDIVDVSNKLTSNEAISHLHELRNYLVDKAPHLVNKFLNFEDELTNHCIIAGKRQTKISDFYN